MFWGLHGDAPAGAHLVPTAVAEVAIEQRNRLHIKAHRQEAAIAELKNAVREESARVNESRAYYNAAVETLDLVIRDLAKVSGVPVEELKKRYNKIRTIEFNKLCNSWLEEGSLIHDPRLSKQHEEYPWYVKGLDADHGF